MLAAIQSHLQGAKDTAPAPSECPSPLEAFLARFSALNPFTAAALAVSVTGVQQLLSLPGEDLVNLAKEIPGLTDRSARLFHAQVLAGTSVRALLGLPGLILLEPAD